MKLTFMGTEPMDNVGARVDLLEPWARECTLQVCVETIESNVTNGELHELVTNVVMNSTIVPGRPDIMNMEPILIQTTRNTTDSVNSANNESSSSIYKLTKVAMLSMQSWFGELFTNGSVTRNKDNMNRPITSTNHTGAKVNSTFTIDSGFYFFDTDLVQAFWWGYTEEPLGIDLLMDRMATSLTVNFRSLNTAKKSVNGTVLSAESLVFVRWGFMTAPLLGVLLTAAFLGSIIYQSSSCGPNLWKTSVLALLLHGLDEDAQEEFD